jgi:group I intron endonuclease
MHRKPGIYSITNIITGFRYIGSSVNVSKRCVRHRDDLKNNRHDNDYLQNAWNKYWQQSFKFEILEYCDKEMLLEREQYWMDTLKTIKPNGYNLKPNANSNLGIKFSLEARANMSAAQKGKKLSKERVEQMRLAAAHKVGIKRDPSIGVKISNALKGKLFSDNHKLNLSISNKNYAARKIATNALGLLSMGC